MARGLICALLILMMTGVQAAPNCSVPRIRTLNGQTVDGTMTVKSGKRCSIVMRNSRGPTFDVRIVTQPSYGGIRIEAPHRVVYQSRTGFVGDDSFTYARRGFDTRNNPVTRTVRIAVTVTP